MKAKLLLITICFIGHLNYAQTTAIPDSNFEQALIDLGYDTAPIDGFVSTATVNSIINLSISNKNITNLSGIEDFTMLRILVCANNNINHLDLSNNTQLDFVFLYDCNLHTLNIQNGHNTDITFISLSNNPFLGCVEVDDVSYSNANWYIKDTQTYYSEDCDYDNTFVPDDNFEQALIDLGYDVGPLDDYVPTSNINSVTYLNLYNKNISDLTGIEDFTNLEVFKCRSNDLTSLDLSENTLLTEVDCSLNDISSLTFDDNPLLERVYCFSNDLTVLDVSSNEQLEYLHCSSNDLTTLDVTNNDKLQMLFCYDNNIVNLDMSQNPELNFLYCIQNDLEFLNVQNGNNSNLSVFYTFGNLYLKCIQVDDVAYSLNNWTNIDPHSKFSTNCSGNNRFSEAHDIRVYPNPTKGHISILSKSKDKLLGIDVYNTLGHQMKANTHNYKDIDLSHLASGTYMIVLNYEDERISKIVYKE